MIKNIWMHVLKSYMVLALGSCPRASTGASYIISATNYPLALWTSLIHEPCSSEKKHDNGATLGTVMNNFYSSPSQRRYLHTT